MREKSAKWNRSELRMGLYKF